MRGPASKIALLDEKFRTRIAGLLKARVTYDEIAETLNTELEEAGLDIHLSSCGIGRYGREIKDTSRRMAETQEFARQLALDLGEREGDQTFELITEMLSHLMFRALQAQTMEDVKKVFNTGDFMKVSLSLKNLTDAKLKDINYRREVRKEALKIAAEASAKVAKEQGLSEDAAREIRRKIMGAPE